jgi:hypothetical protein
MNDPGRRQKLNDAANTQRDSEAAVMSEWLRTKITRG